MEPCVGLCAGHGACLRVSPSAPHPNTKRNTKKSEEGEGINVIHY